MKIASVANIKARFSAYVKSTANGPVVITRNGQAVAAIVPLTDEDDLERVMLNYSPKLQGILTAAHRRIRAGEGIGHEQFWHEVKASAPVRRKRKSI